MWWYKLNEKSQWVHGGSVSDSLWPQHLTHRGWVTRMCVSKLIGSDNGLSPGWRQAIIWTNAGILLIGPVGTNSSDILIEIYTFSFKKMHLKILSGKWRPCCLGLNVLRKMTQCVKEVIHKQWLICPGLNELTAQPLGDAAVILKV